MTNVEMDHPDFFADREAVLESMEQFVRGMSSIRQWADGCC